MRAFFHPKNLLGSASFWAALGIGLKVGAGVIVLPMALSRVPRETLGLYYACTGLTSLILVLDFGFSTTITRFASYAYAGAVRLVAKQMPEMNRDGKPNLPLFAQVASGARMFYILMSGGAFLILLAFGSPQILDLIHAENLPGGLFNFWVMLLGASSLQLVSSVWVGVISGSGMVLEAQRISALGQLLGAVSMAGGLLLGVGIWAFPLGILVSSIFCWVSSQVLLKKILNGHDLTWSKRACFDLIKSAWPMAWRSGASGIGTYFSSRYLVVIVSGKIGLDVAASYGLALQIFGVLAAVLFAPVTVAVPRINMLRMARDNASIRKLFFSRLYLGVGGFMASTGVLLILLPWLLQLIGSNTPLPATLPLLLIGLTVLAEQHQNFYRMLVVSSNVNPFVLHILLSGMIICSVSWFFASDLGLIGVLAAQLLAQGFISHGHIMMRAVRSLNS